MASESKSATRQDDAALGGPATVVESACPLDCPDSCTLNLTVRHGRLLALDGGRSNPVTNGYICAKVRRFGERVYGPDRLLFPAARKGRKGDGRFTRISWDEAIETIADRMRQAIATHGATSILPFAYGGSNGLLTHDAADATLWRRLGTSRLARTLCAAPTGVANMTLYGKMPSVTYQDYP
ncbi:MAG: molybdopterin-dependent oxidoreductase, partial [Vicinamibacterales bacterium]